jgi:hypothetical protein
MSNVGFVANTNCQRPNGFPFIEVDLAATSGGSHELL